MQNLKVTLVQCHQYWENKPSNFDHYTQLLEDIETTDLIVLPEMFNTGFSMNADELFEHYENSPSINWLKALAQTKNAAVYTSLIIKDGESFFNRGVFVYPTGDVIKYDKRKSFGLAGEDKIYTRGKDKVVVNFRGWNILLQICYDLRFPEIARNQFDVKPEYDAVVYVANWPEKRKIHWVSLLQARAIENQAYAVGVNRIGEDNNGLNYSGNSLVVSPLGDKNELPSSTETVQTIELNSAFLDETRSKLPFLKDINC